MTALLVNSYLPISSVWKTSLAKKLGVTTGRISQVLNDPGNLRLKTMIKYARALGLKISIVTYDDNDPNNLKGPVDAEIFEQCWLRAGKPLDFFAPNAATTPALRPLVFVAQRPRTAIASDYAEIIAGIVGTAGTKNLLDKGGSYVRTDTVRI